MEKGERAGVDSLNQPLTLPPDEPLWPILPHQQATVVNTVEEFVEVAFYQPHVDRIVVLRNGIRLLGQQDALPPGVFSSLRQSRTTREFVAALDDKSLDLYKGRLWHFGNHGRATEIVESDNTRPLLDVKAMLARNEESGKTAGAPLYLSEVRHVKRTPHPKDPESRVKAATRVDVFDYDERTSKSMPFWERSDGGMFIGERGAGSGLHVDQFLWSNVGRNWCGHKLLAIWPWKEQCSILDDAGRGTLFHFPLDDRARGLLARAATVALVQPGDVWVFSGGQPHMALTVGDGLSVCAYESFVPASIESVRTLLCTNTKEHWKNCWTDDEDLEELLEEVVDNIQDALASRQTPKRLRECLEDCAQTMRDHGNSYCRRLWAIEDRGSKRRRTVHPNELISLDRETDPSPGPSHGSSRCSSSEGIH